jgi:O-succinylbenzoic acid--CoA ligase
MTTLSVLDAARESPAVVALSDGEQSWSFRDVAELSAPLVARLRAARPGALALTPRADVASVSWLYAALASGTPVLTLHQRASASEQAALKTLVSATDASALPAPPVAPALPAPLIADDAAAVFIPTSGSTGAPRLVELSRRALLASAHASARNLGWEAQDRWLLCLPLAHTGGLSIVARCLLARRSVLLFEPGESGTLSRIDELVRLARQATLISLVPSVLDALLDAGFVATPGLRGILLGGAGCSPSLAERARRAKIPLLTSYGLTETASQVVTRPYAERFEPLQTRNGVVSSGRALPHVELELRAGRIAVRAPSLLSRYVGDTRAPLDAQGWLVTNDHGELADNGELFVRGRVDDVIVSGGENIDPLEVEAALCSLPGVQAACVFGTASEKFGQVVSALLVTEDCTLADPTRLAALLAQRLARHKLPRRTLIAESLPLTSSGKVDRRACSALFEAAGARNPNG